MAIRLGEYIVFGEVYNKGEYGTHGFLVFRGEEDEDGPMQIHFEVTGDPEPDLKGKHFRFEPAEDDGTQIPMPVELFKSINKTQHGVVGTMTAQGWVRALPCTVEEFVNRAALGEAPPTEWRQHLVLEWFGPSGRVLVEMAGPKVEYCAREPDDENEDDEGDWAPLPNLAFPPFLDGTPPSSGPTITRFEREDNEIKIHEMRPFDAEALPERSELQDILDDESDRIDREIAGVSEEEVRGELEHLQRMDYCLEHGEKTPIEAFIGKWSDLPRPESLDDEAVEHALKSLLARLVTCGVVLDVCKHFTPRDCYRLLLDEILPEGGVHEELVGTGWIQHYCTFEYCAECDREFDEKYRESES